MQKKMEFISQLGTAYSDIGCGVAATMMLLRSANITAPENFKTLGDQLEVDIPPAEKWRSERFLDYGKGAFARDISRYLFDELISHILIADTNRTNLSWELFWQASQRTPIMAGMTNNPKAWTEGGHWIVVTRVSDRFVHYLDPGKSATDPSYSAKLSWSRFHDEWDGCAIAITQDGGV